MQMWKELQTNQILECLRSLFPVSGGLQTPLRFKIRLWSSNNTM